MQFSRVVCTLHHSVSPPSISLAVYQVWRGVGACPTWRWQRGHVISFCARQRDRQPHTVTSSTEDQQRVTNCSGVRHIYLSRLVSASFAGFSSSWHFLYLSARPADGFVVP